MEEVQEQSKNALKKAQKQAKAAAAKAEKATNVPIVGGKGQKKDDSKEIIGITVSKEGHFAQWYQDVVIKAELVEYYHEVRTRAIISRAPVTDSNGQISGFYILRREACLSGPDSRD